MALAYDWYTNLASSKGCPGSLTFALVIHHWLIYSGASLYSWLLRVPEWRLQGSGRGQSEKHPSISELPKCFKQGKNPSTVSLSLIFFYLTGKHSRKYQHIMQHEKNMQPYIQVHADWWLCLTFSPPHPVKIVQDDFPGPSSDLLLYYCLFAYSSPANIWVLNQAFFQHWQ